ncbi:replication/maintenance protein RepL [Thalassotalea sp. LPB0316]|uniref:replication/maintenance protein RepL n=1 Tax=Thalassotalea sp. LPB0316 TaxID=2769490 RepID=UPI001865FC9A|nr:replication/maintenance protein RepL [Thalassotalea sp. LPB0316]QOL26234.1 replication/maintenance protein RepL [Thalassotalea sp. LPB0316]
MSNLAMEELTKRENVNTLTGEIEYSSRKVVKLYKQKRCNEHYFSVFQTCTPLLRALTRQQRNVFDLFCISLGYNTNRIDLNSTIRREMADQLSISVGSLNNHLCALKKAGIIRAIGNNSFMVNPEIAFKGSLATALNLKEEFGKLG